MITNPEDDKMNKDPMNAVSENPLIEAVSLPTAIEVSLDSQKAISRIHAINLVIDGGVKVALGRTNPADWVRMGGKLYCQASGIQKMRAVFGLYYRDRQVTRENNEDGSFSWVASGVIGSKLLDGLYGETTIEIIGGRSSNDPFFSGKDGNKAVDSLDVKKAALANWEVRAVTALLGLGNLTEDDLKRHGIDVSRIGNIDYKRGAEGGGDPSVISDAQRKRLFAIMKQVGCPEELLRKYLSEKYKIDSTNNIQRKDYDAIISWIEKGGKE